MNVETLQMDPRIARIHYLDYVRKCRGHRETRKVELEKRAHAAGKELGQVRIEKTRLEKEDEELRRAYRAMSLGQRILNLPRVLKGGGVDPKTHLPKLAIARASWEFCYFQIANSRSCFTKDRWPNWKSPKATQVDFEIRAQVFPAETTNTDWRRNQNNLPGYPVRALVPAIPAHLRPDGDLGDYHILWEAEWTPVAPADPILLKQVSESTFVVLAQWDLTPIEQAILEGRIT